VELQLLLKISSSGQMIQLLAPMQHFSFLKALHIALAEEKLRFGSSSAQVANNTEVI